jgi:hypothetical protein
MPDTANDPSYAVAPRQVDEARADFYAIQSELEVIQTQLARLPTRDQLAQAALGIVLATAVLAGIGIEVLAR